MDLFPLIPDAASKSGLPPKDEGGGLLPPLQTQGEEVSQGNPAPTAAPLHGSRDLATLSEKGKVAMNGQDPLGEWVALLHEQKGSVRERFPSVGSRGGEERRALVRSFEGALGGGEERKRTLVDRLPFSSVRDHLVSSLAWKQTRSAFPLVVRKLGVARQLQGLIRSTGFASNSLQGGLTSLGRATNIFKENGGSREGIFLNLKYVNSGARYFARSLESVASKLQVMRDLDGMILNTVNQVDPSAALSHHEFTSLERDVPELKSVRDYAGGAASGMLHAEVQAELAKGQEVFRAGSQSLVDGMKMLKATLSETSKTFRTLGKANLNPPKGMTEETEFDTRRVSYYTTNVRRMTDNIQDGQSARELKKAGADFNGASLDQVNFNHDGLSDTISDLLNVV